ncbi:hypothetical protein NPIL_559351 [Nephila pilipes]|uniref:Uncharacterized protein n=1 Tax=Nephila pilipes TaxID=299642 RepID=A0A8X6QAG7_NEPPI|nr:hypothetical protein NPIL_559351 [Nephila pilipes]
MCSVLLCRKGPPARGFRQPQRFKTWINGLESNHNYRNSTDLRCLRREEAFAQAEGDEQATELSYGDMDSPQSPSSGHRVNDENDNL